MASSRRDFVRSFAAAPLVSLATGRQPTSIFLSTEAAASERWAAEELRDHLERMTGIRLPIEAASGVPASRRVIAVGRSALTDRCGIDTPEGESCALKTSGETVVIAGGRQRGTMYGVSIFLEKLGCRWFTTDVARVPKLRALRLPELDETHSPGFEYREVFFTEAQGRDWSARNRLNGHFHKLDERTGGRIVYQPFAHAYYDLVPPDVHFASHPEYFSLVSGRRRKENAQLCLTNADVLRLAVQQAEQWLRDHPEVSVVSISQNDGGGWCECEPCRKVIQAEGGAISGLALQFTNQVAVRLAVSHPGKTVDILAYQDTADAPLVVRPLPNVQIRLCPIDACQAHSYRTCAFNQGFRERLEKWSRIAPKLHIWQYSVNFAHFLMPFPNYDALISDIPDLRRRGVSGLFIEGAVSDGGGGDDAELRSYLAARLLWNPGIDGVAEIRAFLEGVYGPAAPLMQKYFALRQYEVRRGQHLWIDQNVDARYLTAGFLRDGRALLRGAAERAGSREVHRRVDRHVLSLDYVEAMRERRCVLNGERYGPTDAVRARRNTDELLKTAAALGITNLREGYPITQQARDWGDPAAEYAAVTLRAGANQAVVVPELEARVIRFGPANILRGPDPGELGYPHGGGIAVSLAGGSLTRPAAIAWQIATARADMLTLNGNADSGHELLLRIGVTNETLRLNVTVRNTGGAATRVAVLCRAEFDCGSAHEAAVRYLDQSGGERERKIRLGEAGSSGAVILTGTDLPRTEWFLTGAKPALRLRNRFQASEGARCGLSWSFRGSRGLTVAMTVASPEVELAPGQQFALTSEYELGGSDQLA